MEIVRNIWIFELELFIALLSNENIWTNHNKKYRVVIINYCLNDASHKGNNIFYDRATRMTCDKELITEIKSGGKTIDQNTRAKF